VLHAGNEAAHASLRPDGWLATRRSSPSHCASNWASRSPAGWYARARSAW